MTYSNITHVRSLFREVGVVNNSARGFRLLQSRGGYLQGKSGSRPLLSKEKTSRFASSSDISDSRIPHRASTPQLTAALCAERRTKRLHVRLYNGWSRPEH